MRAFGAPGLALVVTGACLLGGESGSRMAAGLCCGERLGYAAYGRKPEAWDEQAEGGSVRRYETMCTLMRKELP